MWWWWWRKTNRNVVVVEENNYGNVVVAVVEKTIKMWWWWSWWRTNGLPNEEGFNQAGFQENIPQELLKYLKQQNLSPVPLLPSSETQGQLLGSITCSW